ncbi:NDR1/HIN1-like protein 6 [Spinacia oleracea]|uniref:NDR1/HIN1-like protein 6 n=1 Tax=Spinacia oleracea TaxID=3562 RepID=A0A9R0JKD1_SPIOL|nr:NDR1/HIN1-like protein 6 [Spinacia oleracea]
MYSGQQPSPPPNYLMLENQYRTRPPPSYYTPQPYPYGHAIPQYQSRRSGCHCCVRFICCIACLLFLFICILIVGVVLTYTFYRPMIPIYKIEDLTVTNFNMQPDLSIVTDFHITIKAENPNTKIGFNYGKNSTIVVSFEGSILCSGKLPSFYQPHENVTIINILLTGTTMFGSHLHNTLTGDVHQGRIPLIVEVKVPVTLVLDNIPMRQFNIYVICHMTVDDLKPHKKPKILSTTYSFDFGL